MLCYTGSYDYHVTKQMADAFVVQSFTDIFGLVPANFQIPTKLCTDLPKGMNKRFSVGDIFFTLGKTQEGPGPRPSDRWKILIIRQFELFLPFI